MKLTYFYEETDYGGSERPLKLLKENLKLKELMRKSNDPDYPVNRKTHVLLQDEKYGSILYVNIYPERKWQGSYLTAEMFIDVRNKSEEPRNRLLQNIEDILKEAEVDKTIARCH